MYIDSLSTTCAGGASGTVRWTPDADTLDVVYYQVYSGNCDKAYPNSSDQGSEKAAVKYSDPSCTTILRKYNNTNNLLYVALQWNL